jgi:hypothetical protein
VTSVSSVVRTTEDTEDTEDDLAAGCVGRVWRRDVGEEKGHLRHEVDGATHVYSAAVPAHRELSPLA